MEVEVLSDRIVWLVAALAVLAGLILLTGIVALYRASQMRAEQRAAVPVPPPAAAPAPQPVAEDSSVVAAITAAISCLLAGEAPREGAAPDAGGFVVRRIRRIS